MSQENVEIVRAAFEEFEARLDRDNLGVNFDSGSFAPDCEWIPDYAPGLRSVYRGREGFVEFMRTWTEDLEGWSIRPERLIDVDDEGVVALIHQRNWKREWRAGRTAHGADLRTEGGTRDPGADLHRSRRSPQSRRPLGVGDVAGERGDHPPRL